MNDKELKINKEVCKGCGLCLGVCPDNALEFDEVYNSKGVRPVKLNKKCRLCGQCFLICPDSALEIINEEVMER